MILAYVLLIVMILLWSFSFVLVDIAVEFIPPLSIAFYRFAVASISFLVMDLIILFRKKSNGSQEENTSNSERYTKNDWLLIFLASLTGISIFFFSQYNAINLIGPSLPALFVCLLSPVIIAILALIFFDEKLNRIKIVGFIIATIGGFLLVTGGDISTLAPNSPNFIGYFLALLTPILWGLYSTFTKMIKRKSNLDMLKYACYLGTLELLLILFMTGEIIIFITNFMNLLLFICALYLGLGCYVIGYFIWQTSQKRMDSSKVASFLYIEPFLTLIFSMLLQREETIVFWNIIGGLIVLLAVFLINYKSNNEEIKERNQKIKHN